VIGDLLGTPARQASVLDEVEHRPWALPEAPWVMAQTWDDLLFAHYRLPAEAIARHVPQGLEIDQHDGTAWIGVTPFVITGFRLRGTPPLPGVSSFPELNVRTYVTAEDKPGIWFFSLDTASRLAVEAARRWYKLPYFHAGISVSRRGATIDYTVERVGEAERRFEGRYRPAGETFNARGDSLEHFLTERYCLYAIDRGKLHRADIHHPPWPLQAAEGEIAENTMAPAGLELPPERPLLHFAGRQDVLIWPLEDV
jgi:uncharacterized protein YqjF (DUF2071 family)